MTIRRRLVAINCLERFLFFDLACLDVWVKAKIYYFEMRTRKCGRTSEKNTSKLNPHVGIDLLMQIDSHYVQQGQARIECLQALGLPILKEQQKHVSPPVNEHSLLQNPSSFSIGNIQQNMGWFSHAECSRWPQWVLYVASAFVSLLPATFPRFFVLIWLFDCKCCFILGHCWGKLWRVSTRR